MKWGQKPMSTLTNVWFPEELRDDLRAAVEHYRFPTVAAFFRVCGLSLIEHHKRGDSLSIPFSFHGNNRGLKGKKS
jgi:hypothetical protein